MRRDNPPTSAAARAISEWRRKRIKQQQEREAAVQRAITRIEQQPELADTESYNAAMLGCRLLERPEEALVLCTLVLSAKDDRLGRVARGATGGSGGRSTGGSGRGGQGKRAEAAGVRMRGRLAPRP